MTDTGEKASDTAPGDTPKAGIQSKEKVDAQTDINHRHKGKIQQEPFFQNL